MNSGKLVGIARQISQRALHHRLGASPITLALVMKSNRKLHQSLQKEPVLFCRHSPQVFEKFVGFEEVFPIERCNCLLKNGVRKQFFRRRVFHRCCRVKRSFDFSQPFACEWPCSARDDRVLRCSARAGETCRTLIHKSVIPTESLIREANQWGVEGPAVSFCPEFIFQTSGNGWQLP